MDGRAEVFAADGREDTAVCAWMRNALKTTWIQNAKSKRGKKSRQGNKYEIFAYAHVSTYVCASQREYRIRIITLMKMDGGFQRTASGC